MSLNGCLGSIQRGVGEGLAEKVGKGLAKGWRRVGEELAKGWRVSLHPPILQFPKRPFRRGGLFVTPWISKNRKRHQNRRNRLSGAETGAGTVPLFFQLCWKAEKRFDQRKRRNRNRIRSNRSSPEPNRGHPDYCLINAPGGHLCNLSARFAEMNSPESRICNSAGPCSRHRKLHIQRLIRIRRISTKNMLYFWNVIPPQMFQYMWFCSAPTALPFSKSLHLNIKTIKTVTVNTKILAIPEGNSSFDCIHLWGP